MYIGSDDAKTDVILTGATAVFGSAARGFVITLPLYPRSGAVAAILDVLWILALTALVPILLARHRGDGVAAFGLSGTRIGWHRGLLYLVPVALLGIGIELLLGRTAVAALFGRLAGATGPSGGLALALTLAQVVALTVGGLVLVAFLSVRGRDAYPSSPVTSLNGLIRTVGIAAVAVAAVLGILRAFTGGGAVGVIALHVVALAAVLLVTDRLVPAGLAPPRTVIVTPLVVVMLAQLSATGGVIFGDLASGLYATALAVGAIVAVAASSQTRAGAWAAVPLLVAVHWWPTCLSPLTMAPGLC